MRSIIQHIKRLGAIAVAGALVLTGCATAPDFVRPAAPAIDHYRGPQSSAQQGASDDAPTIALGKEVVGDWWQLFRSQFLDRLVRQAIEKSPTMAAAQATLDEAREAVAAQAGKVGPQVGLTGGVGRQKYGKQFLGPLNAPPPFTYFSVMPQVSYELDYTGGAARSVEEREAAAEYQRQQYRAAYLALTAEVVSEAIAIASAREQLKTIGELLTQDRENVDLVQKSFDAGYATRVDLLSAQSQLAADEALLPPVRQQLDVAGNALAVLTGEFPANSATPNFDLADFELPRELPVSLPSEMARQRPDILAAEAQLHAATAAVGVANADLFPRITLSGSAGQQALTLATLFERSNLVWSLAAGITARIFDGGALRAQQRGAVDAMRASAANYQSTVLQGVRQVADVLSAIDHDSEFFTAQHHSLTVAQQSAELTRESYRAGNVGILNVLDAGRVYQRARLDDVRARTQRYTDTAQLFLALGGVAPDLGDITNKQASETVHMQ